ncbi:hypothetical protein INT48_002923 [Thamnidium elegans]|uniref:DNA polymerase eta n=1 Tax=Thamnidium elegans TaxID=101142 RepID=A0A8H7SL68_9FUNG|nr:hypothetical protein INT48_002923 [Thamnidium elegans]
MSTLPTSLKDSRCILHVDLDCFYCQVEQVRLGIPFDAPTAVQQWRGLIAVNYAARKAGVERHADIDDAKKICPNIKLLHVATYGPDDTEPRYHPNPDRRTHKVSLDPYRNASREIFKIFHKYCDKIQKIGSDEGFLDVTETINQRLMERYVNRMPQLSDKLQDQECGILIDWDKLGVVVTSPEEDVTSESSEKQWSTTTWRDLQLAIGAELAAEIRKEVYDKLQYTCSAGIAHYKTVAKLCSSKNKPNNQTVLREPARLNFMADVPFKKIRNLGGKLGSEVGSDLEVSNASELWKYSIKELQDKFGVSTGLYIYNICRGIDDEEVSATKTPKSLMAAKSFNPAIQNPTEMQPWFSILSMELHTRIMRNYEDFGTWPKNVTIRYRSYGSYRTKVIGSFHKDDMKTNDAYPCFGLDLVASGLSHDESSKSHTLNRFFTTSSTSAHDANSTSHKATDSATTKNEGNRNLFFKKTLPVADAEHAETWVCDNCKQTVSIADIDEHTDYHFALEISKQDDDQIPPNTFVKRKSPLTNEDKKKKVNNFFLPRYSNTY